MTEIKNLDNILVSFITLIITLKISSTSYFQWHNNFIRLIITSKISSTSYFQWHNNFIRLIITSKISSTSYFQWHNNFIRLIITSKISSTSYFQWHNNFIRLIITSKISSTSYFQWHNNFIRLSFISLSLYFLALFLSELSMVLLDQWIYNVWPNLLASQGVKSAPHPKTSISHVKMSMKFVTLASLLHLLGRIIVHTLTQL